MPAQTPTTTIELPHKAYLLPDAIPMWPPAWWTWLVLAGFLLLLLISVAFVWRRHKKRTYRREALHQLKTTDLSDKDCILLCHEMIRRCLISEGKRQLAALPTPTLLIELDKKISAKKAFITLGDDFVSGPYRSHIELLPEQRQNMLDITRSWIRKHHA